MELMKAVDWDWVGKVVEGVKEDPAQVQKICLVVLGGSVLWSFRVWMKNKEAHLNRVRNKKTGERLPRLTYFESLSQLFANRRTGSALAQRQLTERLGPEFGTCFLRPTVCFSKPEDVRYILRHIDEIPKSELPKSIKALFEVLFGAKSLLNMNNPTWHDHRSILNKSFINNKIFFNPLMNKIQQLIQIWKTKEKVFVGFDLQKMTLDALGCCVFGKDFDTLGGNLSGPLNAYNFIIHNLFSPWRFLVSNSLKYPLPINYRLNSAIKGFDEYCWEIINNEKKNHNPNDQQHLISLMIENGLDDKSIRDNVTLFFVAGHETTATSLTWALSMLAQYPSVKDKLKKEVSDITSNFSRELVYEDLKDLVYMDWFIKETMRFYPPVGTLQGRVTTVETEIGNWVVPPNTVLQVDLITMLHSPEIWGNPEEFDPDRWSPQRLTKEQRMCWMPFSYGPRICIGMNFSLVEQKIFLYNLMRQFDEIKFAPGSEIQINPTNLTYAPKSEKLALLFK